MNSTSQTCPTGLELLLGSEEENSSRDHVGVKEMPGWKFARATPTVNVNFKYINLLKINVGQHY